MMHIHRNPFFIGLISFVAIVAIGYTLVFGWKYYHYIILNKTTHAITINGSVIRESEDNYQLQISYSFLADNHERNGSTRLREVYRNEWAANEALKRELDPLHPVWYQNSNPDHSTLQKVFPLKECISTVVLWLLLIYFVWLGFYVATYRV